MKTKPKLLDLCCCEGGAAAGYVAAGFDVTGVDVRHKPRYLLSGAAAFVQADALDYVRRHGRRFDVIHASPPCQRYSVTSTIHDSGQNHPDLVADFREALIATGRPWVIENVPGAPLARGSITLCGLSFGLRVIRHRVFESSHILFAPPHPKHPAGLSTGTLTVKRGGKGNGYSTGEFGLVCVAGNNFVRQAGADAMRIQWMTRKGLAQAIPPAYSEYVGRQLMAVIGK